MPLQGLDFSRSNQALARFNQFLAYDLLDQNKSDRDVALMGIQDRLMRERQVEAGQIDMGVAEYKSALSNEESWTKAKLEFAKQPRFEYLNMWANMAIDKTVPEKYHPTIRNAVKERAAILGEMADAFQQASQGKMSWENAYAIGNAAGVKGLTEMTQEAGSNRRANLAAEVDREKLDVEEKRLTDTGAGRTQAAAEKMTDRYIKWVDDTVSYLVGEGVQGQAMTGEMPIYLESKSRDPLSSQDRGFTLTHLQNIKGQILRKGYGSLTDGQLAFISKVYNTPSVQGFVTEKLKTNPPAPATPAAGARPPRPGGSPAPIAGGTQGGLSPVTGATTAEYDQALAKVRETWIAQKEAEGIEATGLAAEKPAEGESLEAFNVRMAGVRKQHHLAAIKYVDEKIMPTLLKGMR
jgi:hypothetical protein